MQFAHLAQQDLFPHIKQRGRSVGVFSARSRTGSRKMDWKQSILAAVCGMEERLHRLRLTI